MISQTDATTTTLSPATTTAPVANSITSTNNQANSLTIHNGKSSKSLQVRRRKKFDETIIDGFSIVAFKTWEDLQDELNERSSTTNSTSANSNTQSINGTTNSTGADKKANSKQKQKSTSSSSATTNSSANSCLINNQLETGSPGTDNCNSTSATHATSTTTTSSLKEASGVGKKKESAKRTNSNSQANSKDKRNKTSSTSEKLNLKKALEASEKRLSILQEKLKQEQIKNRSTNHNSNNTKNNGDNESIIVKHEQSQHQQKQQKQKHEQASIVVSNHHYSSQQSPTHIISTKVEETIHTSTLRPNGMLGQDITKDVNSQASVPIKSSPYSPFHINSQPNRPSVIHNQSIHQLHPQQSLPHACMHPSQSQHQPTKHSSHLNQSQHSTPSLPTSLSSLSHQPHHLHQQQQQQSQQHSSTPTPPPPQPQTVPHSLHSQMHNQTHLQYQRQTPLGTNPQPSLINPQAPPSPMQRHLLQQQHHYSQTQQTHHHPLPPFPPPMHPYPPHPTQASTMMSSMSLSSLPDPYSCPPSIYITDTITRQTNIIPPIGPALGQLAPQTAQTSSRFGHSSVSHAITPYNPAAAPHQSMYYPTLPTERSFIEFARSYTGPGHLGGYPNLMNALPTPAPSITANPYSFADRWPRIALDHSRAVSSYNRLYQQSTTTLPDRTTYASSYASTRPPHFPAGLFVSNGQMRPCEAMGDVDKKSA